MLMYCWTGLLTQSMFSLQIDVDSYEDGDVPGLLKRNIEQVWNITNKCSLFTLGKYVYIAKNGDVILNSNNVVLVKCQKEKWKKGI